MKVPPLAVFFFAATVPVSAQLYPFDPTKSSGTYPNSINASGAITGYYLDATGRFHGFARDPRGHINPFDPIGSSETVPNSINASGAITGFYSDATGMSHGFVRDPQGNITSFDPTGSNGTYPDSINGTGAITGYYLDATGFGHGFVRDPQGTISSPFGPAGSNDTDPDSINAIGAITGRYLDATGMFHGFVRDPQGNISAPFDPIGSSDTDPFSINASGAITGYYYDATRDRGFVRDPQGNITSFDPTGSNGTYPDSINGSGAITGGYGDATGDHGFVRDPQGNITPFDPAGSIGTVPFGINASGATTGYYSDATGMVHGFAGTAPNGMDVSKYSGAVPNTSWQSAIHAGVSYVIVSAWGGRPVKPGKTSHTEGQLTGARSNGLATAAYVLLNYFSSESATYQVSQAIKAIGSGITSLKFIALDVEVCCGEFVNWQPSHPYAANSVIMDPANHIQIVTAGGTSGTAAPVWNDAGSMTPDGTGTLTWKDTGEVVINQAARIARITAAATYIQDTYDLPVVIYTDGPNKNWQLITGNCGSTGTNSCPALIDLPLWDVEHEVFYAGDGTQHCGDGVAGLLPWTPYGPTTWQTRSGNQYDWGLYTTTAVLADPSWDDDEPAAKPAATGACIVSPTRTLFGLTSVDLDYFDPTLFK